MKAKRKYAVLAALAVVLVLALAGGTTIAYLFDNSQAVVNNFNTNDVDVDIDEPSGQEYKIVPGESDVKDPTVTATVSVDSYLYVLVYGVNPEFTYTTTASGVEETATANAITYAIADGWQEIDLSTITDETERTTILKYFGLSDADIAAIDWDENVFYILYRDLTAADTAQSFGVLKDDTVSYSSYITKEDMAAWEDANGESTVYLAFAAYTIQASPFGSAENALLQVVPETTTTAAP